MSKTTYITTFEVMGSGTFPLDMLRYDTCYPARSEDASRIGYDYTTRRDDRQPIRLVHVGTNKHWLPTSGRWSSFLWSVNCDSIKTYTA